MINQKVLKEIINYDPVTGIVTWKKRVARCVKVGSVAGSMDSGGYLIISIKDKSYRLHRIIWMYVYGAYPEQNIDHINHKKNDNRILNLRQVSSLNNSRNLPISSRNKSGITGACLRKNKKSWRVSISINKKQYEIKATPDFFEACCIRKSAEIKYGYHENHGK